MVKGAGIIRLFTMGSLRLVVLEINSYYLVRLSLPLLTMPNLGII